MIIKNLDYNASDWACANSIKLSSDLHVYQKCMKEIETHPFLLYCL